MALDLLCTSTFTLKASHLGRFFHSLMAIWLSPPTPPSFYLTLPSPAYVVHLQDFFWYQLRSHLLGESQQRALWQGEIFDRFNYQKIGEYLKKFMERVIKRDFFFFFFYSIHFFVTLLKTPHVHGFQNFVCPNQCIICFHFAQLFKYPWMAAVFTSQLWCCICVCLMCMSRLGLSLTRPWFWGQEPDAILPSTVRQT